MGDIISVHLNTRTCNWGLSIKADLLYTEISVLFALRRYRYMPLVNF